MQITGKVKMETIAMWVLIIIILKYIKYFQIWVYFEGLCINLDSATNFNISVKMKCKQTNPRFLTNVTTSGDVAHVFFGWFLKWIKERFYFESFRDWSLIPFTAEIAEKINL
jgi:hypothetical protein